MSIFSKAFGKNKKTKTSLTDTKPESANEHVELPGNEDQIAQMLQKKYSENKEQALDIPLDAGSSSSRREIIDLSHINLEELDYDLSGESDTNTFVPLSSVLEINPTKSFSNQVDLDLKLLKKNGFITPDDTNNQISNTFRVIKRPLLNNVQGKGASVHDKANMIMVTSALSNEGKSFSAINLALSIAMEKDKRVLLIDADVNKPSHHELFGLDMKSGLIDLLRGREKDMSQLLHKTNIPSLSLMFAGNPSSQATELLASSTMNSFIEDVSTRYPDRIVIFDSPPLLMTTESSVLASYMGQVIMVVEAERTLRHHVLKGLDMLSNEIVLMLLNKMREKNEIGNYGYYGYGHKSDSRA